MGANAAAETLGLGATLAADAGIILSLEEPRGPLAAAAMIMPMTATGAIEGTALVHLVAGTRAGGAGAPAR